MQRDSILCDAMYEMIELNEMIELKVNAVKGQRM